MTKIDEIDLATITQEEFLEKAVTFIGEVKKNDDKTLSKDSFIKIFKYTGDYAKLRSKGIKTKAQLDRVKFFDVDHKEYLKEL